MKPVSTVQKNRQVDVKIPGIKRAIPKLLISIRDRRELATVLDCGVDIIDLKEPGRGPLAPTDPRLWSQAAALWEGRRPASSLSGFAPITLYLHC